MKTLVDFLGLFFEREREGKKLLHCLEEQLYFLGSLPSNDVAQNTSPVKTGAGSGSAVGYSALESTDIAVMFWRPPSLLSCTRNKPLQTDRKARLSSEDAFNFHKDDFVS